MNGDGAPNENSLVSNLIRVALIGIALLLFAGLLAMLVWWGKDWEEVETPAEEPVVEAEEKIEPVPATPERAAIELRAGPREIRPTTVAGTFYPGDEASLYAEVEDYLAAAPRLGLRGVRAILVPHAGYRYSAEVAAASFREISPDFRRVFILAANHNGRARIEGPSILGVTHYAVPGAEVPLDAIADELMKHELFEEVPEAHGQHMIELELPFLHFLRGRPDPPDYTIVPMIVGRMGLDRAEALAEELDRYVEEDTLFVFSVDLSHFYDDATARRLDGDSIQAVLAGDYDALSRVTTDGNHVLQTMVALARRRGWEPTFLMARNSGEVSGDRSRVVGYASIVFQNAFELTAAEQHELLAFARDTVEQQVKQGSASEAEESWLETHPVFRTPRGVFVTLKKGGRLRGCIGQLTPNGPLHAAVRDAAIGAAVRDSRFSPVREAELAELSYSISILGPPSRVEVDRPEQYLEVLRPGIDGVILVHEGRRSTFLPQVWEDLADPEEFLTRLSLKQGSPADAWRSPETAVYRYGAFVFGADGAKE